MAAATTVAVLVFVAQTNETHPAKLEEKTQENRSSAESQCIMVMRIFNWAQICEQLNGWWSSAN